MPETMTELQLWQSIASLNCVEGLRIDVDVRLVKVEYDDDRCWFGEYDHTPNHIRRRAALFIVDAIEASSDWRFSRDGRYQLWHAEKGARSIFVDGVDQPEHLSLLTVIERVMRAIKEAKK